VEKKETTTTRVWRERRGTNGLAASAQVTVAGKRGNQEGGGKGRGKDDTYLSSYETRERDVPI